MTAEGAKHLSKGKWLRLTILDLSKDSPIQVKTLLELRDFRRCFMQFGHF